MPKRFWLVFGFALLLVGCFSDKRENNTPAIADEPSAEKIELPEDEKIASSLFSRRAEFPDFPNFRFPYYCFAPGGEPFSLVEGHYTDPGGGEMTLSRVKYADVTGDGVDEALVVLAISTGGTSHPYCVYIFAANPDEADKPQLVWTFRTGDRADGGLRHVYGENGQLAVETYLPDEKNGDCCPKFFKREVYAFANGKFTPSDSSTHLNPDRTSPLVP